MAKCDISVVLDEPDKTYAPGEKVTGRVNVRVDEPCACKKITVSFGWETSGRGNTRSSLIEHEVASESTIQPGEHVYPFAFEIIANTNDAMPDIQGAISDNVKNERVRKALQDAVGSPDAPLSKLLQGAAFSNNLPGPFTYRGQVLNINWLVRAQAHIPWKADARAEKIITVLPGKEPPAGYQLKRSPSEHKENEASSQWMKGCLFVCLLFIAFGATALYAIFSEVEIRGLPDVFGFVFIFSIIGVVGAVYFTKKLLVSAKISSVQVQLDSAVVTPGDKISCVLSFQGKSALQLENISALLEAKEVVVSGSGKNKSTRTHKVFTKDVELSPARELYAGQPLRLQKEIQIPQDAPYSIGVYNNALEWNLYFRVRIKRWPDWTHAERLHVVPWALTQ